DPHTGQITTPQFTHVTEGGSEITRVSITLATMRSVLLTSPYTGPTSIGPGVGSRLSQPRPKLSVVPAGKNLLLTYSIPKSGREEMAVRLEIFDVKGER